MKPKPMDPQEKPGGGSRGERVYGHPAFGMIGGGRVSGRVVLHGSDFEHQHFIEIRIKRAELHRDLSRDWHHAREEIVSVFVSEAQWATFVSSLNQGEGVPCTLNYVNGEPMPGLTLHKEEDTVRREAHEHFAEMTALVDQTIREVEQGIGASLSKVKRDAILASLQKLRRDIKSNTPFMMNSFAEHMEKTVERAKVEVNAYMQNVVARAGIAALTGADAPLRLDSGEKPPVDSY